MDLKEEEILGDHVGEHWYYRSKARAMLNAIDGLDGTDSKVAIDVGSGSGFFARQILEHTAFTQVDCVDTSYRADADEQVAGGKRLRRRCDLVDAVSDADLAILMDVLEHVDDDVDLLATVSKRLRPGGRALITVPAFNWLWSGHDVFLEHRRRYSLRAVEAMVADAGLTMERGHYFFGLLFPAAAAQRLVSRLRPEEPGSRLRVHAPAINRILATVSIAETRVQRYNRLAGLSVFALARRS